MEVKKPVRLIIAGGRDFQDRDLLCKTLDELIGARELEIEVVSGTARGADQLGERIGVEQRFEQREGEQRAKCAAGKGTACELSHVREFSVCLQCYKSNTSSIREAISARRSRPPPFTSAVAHPV